MEIKIGHNVEQKEELGQKGEIGLKG